MCQSVASEMCQSVASEMSVCGIRNVSVCGFRNIQKKPKNQDKKLNTKSKDIKSNFHHFKGLSLKQIKPTFFWKERVWQMDKMYILLEIYTWFYNSLLSLINFIFLHIVESQQNFFHKLKTQSKDQ